MWTLFGIVAILLLALFGAALLLLRGVTRAIDAADQERDG